jgi:DNA (cytosine-5)-methyltransferase 1
MPAYYNEIDPYAAQWLRNLIEAGHIAPGDVDERSIVDVQPADLAGYEQAHFFAGIGGWSIALRLAGWPDDRPVWTGSCPCQPFSAAGAGKAGDDERHLWPAWFPLIAERHPAIVFGEQVEAAIGWGWLDLVFADLEGEGYACGTTVLPACGVGASHIRQRAWFVADARCGTGVAREPRTGGAAESGRQENHHSPERSSQFIELADAAGGRFGEFGDAARPQSGGHADGGFWACDWLPCTDGKARPVRPGSFPLAHGVQRRTSKLRAYGNAIVPPLAAEFIIAASEAMTLTPHRRAT